MDDAYGSYDYLKNWQVVVTSIVVWTQSPEGKEMKLYIGEESKGEGRREMNNA